MRSSHLPRELYLGKQIREMDRQVIATGISGIELMNRAAQAVFDTLIERWPEASSILFFCGTGNNGGDGFLSACIAKNKGLSVTVVLLGDPQGITGDALIAYNRMQEAHITAIEWKSQPVPTPDIVVDAMLGTGIKGTLGEKYHDVIQYINHVNVPVIAVDIPSGICCDSGLKLGEYAVKATLTVTFIALKRGIFTGDAVCHVGEVLYFDLGAPQAVKDTYSPASRLLSLQQLAAHYLPVRQPDHHKYLSGQVVIIGGDEGMAGAPLLAAIAALKAGAGIVSLVTHRQHIGAIISKQPEIMAWEPQHLSRLLKKCNALVIGPGLGQSQWSRQLLYCCLQYQGPTVWDADALNLIASESIHINNRQSIITPHPGEAHRLTAGKLASTDRFALADYLTHHYQAITVLKGAGTLVTDQTLSSICPYGNPVLATAGSGDVLSGIIGALLAQGLTTLSAAQLAVCLHASAADLWAEQHGTLGMLATELTDSIRTVINQLHSKAKACDVLSPRNI